MSNLNLAHVGTSKVGLDYNFLKCVQLDEMKHLEPLSLLLPSCSGSPLLGLSLPRPTQAHKSHRSYGAQTAGRCLGAGPASFFAFSAAARRRSFRARTIDWCRVHFQVKADRPPTEVVEQRLPGSWWHGMSSSETPSREWLPSHAWVEDKVECTARYPQTKAPGGLRLWPPVFHLRLNCLAPKNLEFVSESKHCQSLCFFGRLYLPTLHLSCLGFWILGTSSDAWQPHTQHPFALVLSLAS